MTDEKKQERSPNDQRSDANNPTSEEYHAAQVHNANVHNPTSAEYQAAMANRANQMNPQHPAYSKSRGKK